MAGHRRSSKKSLGKGKHKLLNHISKKASKVVHNLPSQKQAQKAKHAVAVVKKLVDDVPKAIAHAKVIKSAVKSLKKSKGRKGRKGRKSRKSHRGGRRSRGRRSRGRRSRGRRSRGRRSRGRRSRGRRSRSRGRH